MELTDVIMRLIGPVDPIGSTETDDNRFNNLITLCDITYFLQSKIEDVANENKNRCEYSMSRAGKYAEKELAQLREQEDVE